MSVEPVDGAGDIDKLVRSILIDSRAWGKFPTPVDDIVAYTELSLAQGIDLSKVEPSFFDMSREFIGRINRKVLGIFDFRQKIIYLDQSQRISRQNFIKLHETGHGVIPCQRDLLGFIDDEDTLSADVKALFEQQASYFASGGLFQLERFDEEAAKLPLSIHSARILATKFGGSVQAALRRYVERSPKRCALLVLHKPTTKTNVRVSVRNFFESASFTAVFGGLIWPPECGIEYPFVVDITRNRRDHQDGQVTVTTSTNEAITLQYHFFNNTFNIFVLLFPAGEKISSRVKIIER